MEMIWLRLCYLMCTLLVNHPHNCLVPSELLWNCALNANLPCLVNLALILLFSKWNKLIKGTVKTKITTVLLNVISNTLKKRIMFSTKHIKQHDVTWAAKHSAFPSEEYITFYNILKWKMVILNCNISQFYCIFDQINVALVRFLLTTNF